MLTYNMQERGGECLYEYLYRCIRADIESGAIAAGEHLPSKRKLAKHLGVSLITVEGAYEQLMAEGYVRSQPRRGYFACELPRSKGMSTTKQVSAPVARAPSPEGGGLAPTDATYVLARDSHTNPNTLPRHKAPGPNVPTTPNAPVRPSPTLANFADGSVPYDESVARMWLRSLRSTLDQSDLNRTLANAAHTGLPQLRSSIARYLRGFRGMEVDPRCIVIGAGAQALYPLIVQLVGRSTAFAVEDPGYKRLARIYRANGATCHPVALDSEGIDVQALERSRAQVAHIMPSHQFPCGTVTSIGRRYQLLSWANEASGRLIVEDDYDSEFRLAGRPIPSLASIDTEGKVIYLNTFSKSLGPALRVAYMVLPPALMQQFERSLDFYSCTVSPLDQAALAQLMDCGDYERHVNRYRTRHRAKRDALLDELQRADAQGILRYEEIESGLHFVLAGPLAKNSCETIQVAEVERSITTTALQGGVVLAPLSGYALDSANYALWQSRTANGVRPRFVMQYGNVPRKAMDAAASAVVRSMG